MLCKSVVLLFVSMTEPRTHFEEHHGRIHFGSCVFLSEATSSQVLIQFLTFFPNLTVLWLLFCGEEEVSTEQTKHVVCYQMCNPLLGNGEGCTKTVLSEEVS